MTSESFKSITKARVVSVGDGSVGQRLDNFLLKVLKGVPKTRVYRALRTGEVRVNKARAKPYYRLLPADKIRIPPIRSTALRQTEPPIKVKNSVTTSILLEDDNIIIFNKPAGLAVHGGSGRSFGLIEVLRSERPNARYMELVHRLDHGTSGCLIVAKKRKALTAIHALIRQGKVKKDYWLMVKGKLEGGRKEIDLPLRKTSRSGERLVVPDTDGKAAQTLMRPLSGNGNVTLVQARLLTGRTHQIRVHASAIGYPVAGDAKYGNPAFNKWCRARGLQRLFLHARFIEFQVSDQHYKVTAPLTPSLEFFVDSVGLQIPK